MKSRIFSLLAAAGAMAFTAACGASTADASVIYDLLVKTTYGFGPPLPGTQLNNSSASPDTGYLYFQNVGPSTFTGTLGTLAVSNFAGDLSFTSGLLTLNPGDSVYITIGDESSNVGGFNGPFGADQPGIQALINGDFNGTPVALSVFDSAIHSGVFRTNPYGQVLDSYVLQGGDSFGRDTGDDFEVTQAFGVHEFALVSDFDVPLPAALPLMAAGLGSLGATQRWRKRKTAA